ncbi:hypothetical protein GCM10027265_39920 [Jatrophihabitans fulvus]
MRALGVAVSAALAVTGAGVVAAAPAAARTVPLAGSYVALATPTRVADTRTGAAGNPKGAVRAGGGMTVVVAGRSGVPATGVGAAVLTVTAVSATGTGSLVAFPYGTTHPTTRTVSFTKGQRAITATTVVPLRSGRIAVHNFATSGTVQVTVDVSGYYRSGAPSSTEPGVYRAVTPSHLVDTTTGLGVKKARVAAGKSISVSLGGRGGLPATPGAVAATITAVSPTKSGTFTAGRSDESAAYGVSSYGYITFSAGRTVSAFVPLRVEDGKAVITNVSSGTVDLRVDVVGFWNLGFAQQPDTFQTRVQTRLPTVSIPANGTRTIAAGGRGGVERSGVRAVLVTLHVVTPSASGALQVSAPGARAGGAAVQFDAGASQGNVVVAATASNGSFAVKNLSARALSVIADIDGYVPGNGYTQPTGKATARYLEGLTGTLDDGHGHGDLMTMAEYGQQDATAGYAFVLLDVGAQSVSSPVLSKSTPGVSLALTSKRVPYVYADLVKLVKAYITGYLGVSGHPVSPIVAVGTNNSGAGTWDPGQPATYYAPASRGADWANQVIERLQRADVRVRAANDIEAGFVSDQHQALDWESSYLSAATLTGSGPELYFIGSADGCPKGWRTGTCAYGWTPAQMITLASQPGVAAVPQIYLGYQATQWAELAAYAHSVGKALSFTGILTQFARDDDTLTPTQAASAINRALLSVGRPPLSTFVADFGLPRGNLAGRHLPA